MRRGRVIFWSISGTVIAAGVAACVWYTRPPPTRLDPPSNMKELQASQKASQRAGADRPPEPWASPNPWWKKTTIDAYDRANAGKSWPSGRRAVVAFARDFSEGPRATGDDEEDALSASATAVDYECDDPLVLFIRGTYLWGPDGEGRERAEAAQLLARAADAFPASPYPAIRKCLGLLRAADAVAWTSKNQSNVDPAKAQDYADAGLALAREALADPDLPADEAYRLVRSAGRASLAIRRDRRTLVNKVFADLQRSPQPKTVVLAALGEHMTSLAWDARGDDVAAAVTREGWEGFRARLADARTALTEAWELDHTNAYAAAQMITVCMGEGAGRAEMERWFTRAIEADPGNYGACTRKLLFLEPKWGGSPVDMVLFGRELSRRAATEPRSARLPLNLVDAHWTLGQYAQHSGSSYPAAEYFAGNADAWSDVSGVYETYLAKVPESRYHRTRYAVIAAWAGHWDVAAAQFNRLGSRSHAGVMPASTLTAIRDQAKRKAAAK